MAIISTNQLPYVLATDARRVFDAADLLARTYEYEYLSTDHVLLGIFHAEPNRALDMVNAWGISEQEITSGLALKKMGGVKLDYLRPNPCLVGVLDLATKIAQERGDVALNAEDLLMALLCDNDSHAGAFLRQLLLL